MHAKRLSVLAFVIAGVLGTAAPAFAHALLLNTQPYAGTTVATAPRSVRLTYSEHVEAVFGSVRVYDVNGHRVDLAHIRLVDGGRTVDVPVAHLADGTYTVTWRVVSADGHPVHGGFVFYVRAPSPVPPVTVGAGGDEGAIVAVTGDAGRFLWFTSLLLLVGLVVVRRWVWTPSLREALPDDDAVGPRFRTRFRAALFGSWIALLVAAGVVLWAETADASGLSLLQSLRPSVLGQILGTSFGHYWLWSAAGAIVLGIPVYALASHRRVPGRPTMWIGVGGALAAEVLVATALNGHARTGPHPALLVTAEALHLTAAAVWVGALAAVVLVARPAWRLAGESRSALVGALVRRFSPIAMVSVGVLAATAIVNAFGGLHSVSDLWRTTYGALLIAKTVLFGAALALAARHRFVSPRRLASATTGDQAVRSFTRSATIEAVALLAVVVLSAVLVGEPPARVLASAAAGPVDQTVHAGRYNVNLFVDPSQPGADEFHLTFVTPDGLAADDVTNATMALTGPGQRRVPMEVRIIVPGHFVGDTRLRAGAYVLAVTGRGSAVATATFRFRIKSTGRTS